MKAFPEGIGFKYPWRKYQHRVLAELQEHLTDRHLHVIAPPGSGKTLLGLEVMLRINQPALILAPTLAIRNQWIHRFCELFLQTNQVPDWISRDIRNPKLMTVVTYQALYAACNNLNWEETEQEQDEDEEDRGNEAGKTANKNLNNIVNGLKSRQVKTIVVDEAHHLKNEWWQTLTKVKEHLDPVIVGLTATPPYDVSPIEWQRYIELNGPVDTEISVPELVIEGDLCPHQDYVYFSLPTQLEFQSLHRFRAGIEKLFKEVKEDETLAHALENHPVWLDPAGRLEWIYSNIAYYSATLIFLNAAGKEIPGNHLRIIGNDGLKIPELDYSWIETLLDFYLYKEKEHFKAYEAHRSALEHKLKRYGASERRQISFTHNKQVTGLLNSSIGKLNGIKDIVNFEYRKAEHNTRLVILSDFVRKEFYLNAPENNLELNKIGVIPIFEQLRRDNPHHIKIGVLTGSIIIIPVSALSIFQEKAAGHDLPQIAYNTVPFDQDYVLIQQQEQIKHDLVHLVTQVFQQGEIEVLIGTKSLLGEGWDAPAINALILASFVGSFVLSNQMRGRAIRTQPSNPDKTGNIWHLVCIDPTAAGGGEDFEMLRRRFKSFVGVSFGEEPSIENGVNRLQIPENMGHPEEITRQNDETFQQAGDRASLKERWGKALQSGVRLTEEIKIPFAENRPYKKVKKLYLSKTIAYLIAELMFGLLAFAAEVFDGLLRSLKHIKSLDDLLRFLGIIGLTGLIYFGKQLYTTTRLYIKYRDIAKDMGQIGNALLYALIETGAIHTARSKLKVMTTKDELGAVYCHLEGGTTFEKSLFINTLQEVIGPVDNPRYVIVRKSMFLFFVVQKDYHAVPEIIGRNKNLATYFKDQWERLVGDCDLIFTRSIEGRRLLLKSRIKSLAAQFEHNFEHVNKWR